MNGLLDNEKIIVTDLWAFHTGNTKPSPYHQNRFLHGFVIRCDGQKKYIFDDGTEYTHNKYDIIYLPKGSTYTVKNTELILKIYGTTQHYRNTGAKAGLNFGKDVNDFMGCKVKLLMLKGSRW